MKCFENGLQEVWIFTLIFNKVREYNMKLFFRVKVEANLKISAEFHRNTHRHHCYIQIFFWKVSLVAQRDSSDIRIQKASVLFTF